MARFLTHDEEQARALLRGAGVEFDRVDDLGDAPAEIQRAVLPDGERQVRDEVDVPVPEDPDAGMGAWHINAVEELHTVTSGEGILEFITDGGPVGVVVEGGDVVTIRRAEHRYRALTPQHWVLRFTGGPDAELGPVDTGRTGVSWSLH